MKKMSQFFMQLGYFFVMLIIAGLFILFTTLARCTSPSKEINNYENSSMKDVPKVHKVEIMQMKFSPGNITVQKGDTIVFINHDLVIHNITEASVKKWVSPPLQPEQSWKIKIEEASNYYCSLHPVMKGIINIK